MGIGIGVGIGIGIGVQAIGVQAATDNGVQKAG